MGRRRWVRSCVGVAVLGAALVGVALVPSASAGAAADPWRPLLARVPDTGAYGSFVVINDYAAAREASGVEPVADRVRSLFRLQQATGIAPSRLFLASGPGDPLDDELGIRSSGVTRDLQAGLPPDQLTILEGKIDRGRVRSAVEADENFSDRLETARHGGQRYYTWGDDRVDVSRRSPLRPLGRGGNLAVDPPFATWSDRAAAVEASIDATAGKQPSLADDADLVDAMDALHARGAYAAFLSTDEVAPGVATGGPPALAPYRALAVGPSLPARDRHQVVVVLAYDDHATATEQAARLQAIAEDGVGADGPWSALLEVDSVRATGTLVVGTFTTEKPQLWIQMIERRDSLLATT